MKRPKYVSVLNKLAADEGADPRHRLRAATALARRDERAPRPPKTPKAGLTPRRLVELHARVGALGTSWAELVDPPSWAELGARGFGPQDIEAAGYGRFLAEIPDTGRIVTEADDDDC